MKPRVGVFAFTSCEGCSLIILSLEDQLPDLIGAVEFVNFREAMDVRSNTYDIAFIDGAITRKHEVAELEKIRSRAGVLVAMGACAVQGGLYALRDLRGPQYAAEQVYGKGADAGDVLPVRPAGHYVKVDHSIYGCPIDGREFLEVVRSAITGKRPDIPDYPVCNECRKAQNICAFDRGLPCFGPVTRAGCGAICPSHGGGCCGCRGLVDEPMLASHLDIMKRHGFTDEFTAEGLRLFNNCAERTCEKP